MSNQDLNFRGGASLTWTPDGYLEPKAIKIIPSSVYGTVTIERNNSFILNGRVTISLKGTIKLNQDVGSYGSVVYVGQCEVDGSPLTMSARCVDSVNSGNALSRISGTGDYKEQRFCLDSEIGFLGFVLTADRSSGQTLDFVLDKSFPFL